MIFKAKRQMGGGLHISLNRVDFAIDWPSGRSLGGSFPVSGQDWEQGVASAFSAISAETRKRFVPVGVVVADPWVKSAIVRVDEWPKAKQEQRQLAGFLFEKEFRCSSEAYRLSCHSIRVSPGGNIRLIIEALPSDWLASLEASARQSGVMMAGVDSTFITHFVSGDIHEAKHVDIHCVVDTDYWTLYALDRAGRPIHVHSRWCKGFEAGNGLIPTLIAELRRIRASINHWESTQGAVVISDWRQRDAISIEGSNTLRHALGGNVLVNNDPSYTEGVRAKRAIAELGAVRKWY